MLQDDLLQALWENQSLRQLFSYDNKNTAPFAVGLPESLQAAAGAAGFVQQGVSLCLVAPDTEAAAAYVQNLRAWLPEQQEQVLLLPQMQLSPLAEFQPEAEVIAGRVRVLEALAEGRQPVIVVVPAEALLGKFASRETFAAELLTL